LFKHLIVFEILKIIVQATVLFQYVYLFITKTYSNPVRRFSNKVSFYAYRVMRYVTLNENTLPFPFADFQEETDVAVSAVRFEYSSSHKYVPIGYKHISGIRTNHFDNFVNVLGKVKRKN
jgi:hypothetical protein